MSGSLEPGAWTLRPALVHLVKARFGSAAPVHEPRWRTCLFAVAHLWSELVGFIKTATAHRHQLLQWVQ